MKTLKICRKCGNKYGYDKNYTYSCSHHKIESKGYPLPKDFSKLIGIINAELMSYKEAKKRFGKYYEIPRLH